MHVLVGAGGMCNEFQIHLDQFLESKILHEQTITTPTLCAGILITQRAFKEQQSTVSCTLCSQCDGQKD